MEKLIEVHQDILQDVAKVIEIGLVGVVLGKVSIEPKARQAIIDLCLLAKNERMRL